MKYILGILTMALSPLALAQNTSFIFTSPDRDASAERTSSHAADGRTPLITDLTTGDLKEMLIEISFYRQLHSRLSSESPEEVQGVLDRFSLTANEGLDVEIILGDWKRQTAATAATQLKAMCDFWSTRDSTYSDTANVEIALTRYTDLEPAIDTQMARLNDINNRITRYVNGEAASIISLHLEVRQRSKTGIGYINWPDAVRARGNSINELNSVCGEQG